jgi:hypothetical protein
MSFTETYSYATLPVSVETFAEIRKKLEEAGYQHLLQLDGNNRPLINMRGIALVVGTNNATQKPKL